MLDNKAKVDVGDHTVGCSPLAGAVIGSNSRIGNVWKGVSERYRFVIRYLIDAGANPNVQDNNCMNNPYYKNNEDIIWEITFLMIKHRHTHDEVLHL